MSGRIAVGLMSRIGSNGRFLSLTRGIMDAMDDTQLDQLVSELESADPADAPEVADTAVAELAKQLDALTREADPAPEA
jgi:hypothetical protein